MIGSSNGILDGQYLWNIGIARNSDSAVLLQTGDINANRPNDVLHLSTITTTVARRFAIEYVPGKKYAGFHG